VRRFAENQMINYPVLVADQKVFAAYGRPTHLPTTFLIDRKGVVRYVHLGVPRDLRVYQREAEELLGE
jgi:peroxiredoxin